MAEEIQGTGLDLDLAALLKPKESTQLRFPNLDLSGYLANVSVGDEGRYLVATTDIGQIALRVLYDNIDDQPEPAEATRFYPALLVGDENSEAALLAALDPDTAEIPELAHQYPYTEVPYGVHFGIELTAQTNRPYGEFTEPEIKTYQDADGMYLRDLFGDPTLGIEGGTKYNGSALKSSRFMLGLAIRNNGGEPLYRTKHVMKEYGPDYVTPTGGFRVHYAENVMAPFRQSGGDPTVSRAIAAFRLTDEAGTKNRDAQRLRLIRHNSNQGKAGKAGLTEVVLVSAEEVRYSAIDLEPVAKKRVPPPPRPVMKSWDGGGSSPFMFRSAIGGFDAAEVAYGAPQRVRAGETVRVDSVKPIGALRFLIVGAHVEEA